MAISTLSGFSGLGQARALDQSQSAWQKAISRLASGTRLLSAADDAAGLAIADDLNAQARGMSTAMRNGNDGISMMQVADGAMQSIGGLLGRMRELSVQAGNGTLNASNRKALDAEYQQLKAEVDRISKTAEFNGTKVLDGSAAKVSLQLGANSGDDLEVALGTTSSASLGLSSSAITNGAQARDSLTAIDEAMKSLMSRRVNIGAMENRVGTRIDSLTQSYVDTRASESRIRDADVAQEVANLAREQIVSQSAVAMMAQSNSQAATALSLLR